MMMIQNLIFLFTCSSLLLASFHFFQACNANCTPSACGLIPNISSPFRLKTDPNHCGDHKYELVCENNVASVQINSHTYYVKEINYSDFSIWIAHASIDNGNSCSFPMSSDYEGKYFDPYYLDLSQRISLMSCQHPLHNSSLKTQVTDCGQSTTHTYTYIKVGELRLTDLEYTCKLDSVVATYWNFTDLNNVSLSEIHQSLLYGFKLSWLGFICRKCKGAGCYVVPDGRTFCHVHHSALYYDWGKTT